MFLQFSLDRKVTENRVRYLDSDELPENLKEILRESNISVDEFIHFTLKNINKANLHERIQHKYNKLSPSDVEELLDFVWQFSPIVTPLYRDNYI